MKIVLQPFATSFCIGPVAADFLAVYGVLYIMASCIYSISFPVKGGTLNGIIQISNNLFVEEHLMCTQR